MKNHNQKSIAYKFSIPFTVFAIFWLSALAQAENIEKAWLGIATSKIDEVVATQLDLPEGVGAAVK